VTTAGLLAAVLLLACSPGPSSTGQGSAPPAAPQPAEARVETSRPAAPQKVRSAYTTISAAVASFWAALEAGYFSEQGLDVEFIRVDAGAPLLAALSNNELDIVSAGGTSLVLGNLQGMEAMIIGATSSVLDSSVFVRPEIQTIDDLRGKTIGVTNLKAITDTAARLGLSRVGLTPDVDVFTRRTGGLAESLAGMETGALEGASLAVPVVFEARRRGYRELVNVTELRIPFLNSAVGSTKKVLAERPDIAEPYLRALAQGSSRLKTDREFAIDVLGKYGRMDDRELLGATVDYYQPLYQVDPYPDPATVQTILDEEENPAARTARPQDVIDDRFAARLRSSGFLDPLPK
jgi:ABC-type nitrate/sulfonate/bicarbonate transport system substrate-binding protein